MDTELSGVPTIESLATRAFTYRKIRTIFIKIWSCTPRSNYHTCFRGAQGLSHHDRPLQSMARGRTDLWVGGNNGRSSFRRPLDRPVRRPLRLTTEQRRQSHLFRQLNRLTGSSHFHTTAYHSQANGMVERFHRQLKAAIKYHQNDRWTETLSTVLLGVRSAWKEDLQATAAEILYGTPLRLPGEFLSARISTTDDDNVADFVKELRQRFQDPRPVNSSHHGGKKPFIFKDLASTDQVFVRHNGPKGPLQLPYDGPFRVVSRKKIVCHPHSRSWRNSLNRPLKTSIYHGRGSSGWNCWARHQGARRGTNYRWPSHGQPINRSATHRSRTKPTSQVKQTSSLPRPFTSWILVILNHWQGSTVEIGISPTTLLLTGHSFIQ